MPAKLSVIIPTYNEERVLGDCLESITKQNYTPVEIIIVDDGSTDSTREVIQQYQVKFLSQSHLGPGPARNLGAEHASGRILVFVDSDMTFEPDFLEKLTLPIIKGQAIGTFSRDEIVSNWDNVWSRCWNYNNLNRTPNRVRDNPHDSQDYRAILASEFKRVGGFSFTGYTDSRTLVNKLNTRPHLAPGAKYYHRNPSSLIEVFHQSVWIGRRQTRFGLLGQLFNLLRSSPPVSLFGGIVIGFRYHEIRFPVFKIIYDLGFSWGIISNILWHQTAR